MDQKRIKGSAIVDEEGMFIFTPYGQSPPDKKSKILAARRWGTVRAGKHTFTLQVSVRRSETNDPVYVLLQRAAELTALAREYQRKYSI